MKAETPATGIMKKADYGDAIQYEIECECGSKDHYHSVWIEADAAEVSVNISAEATTDYWTEYVQQSSRTKNDFLYHTRWNLAYIVNETVRRAKLIWSVLTKGYVKYHSNIILNQQQAVNYAEAIKKAVRDVERFRKS